MKKADERRQNVFPISSKTTQRIRRKQAAAYLGISLSWLDKARVSGRGPPFIVLGSSVLYDIADLDTFLQRNRHSSTSEQY
jgi:hypothetical protein